MGNGSKNDVSGLAPNEGFGIGIVRVGVVADGLLQIGNAAMCVALDPLLADLPEESLHQVEPGGGGRREVHVVAWRTMRAPFRSCACRSCP